MSSKRNLVGMMVMALVFGVFFTGCETAGDGDVHGNTGGYTFEFRVENSHLGGLTPPVTQIEIFNGPNTSSQLLASETFYIPRGQMSDIYRVSGFTDRDGSDKRIFGVRITFESYPIYGFEDGRTLFGFSSAINGSKLLVWTNVTGPQFRNGNW